MNARTPYIGPRSFTRKERAFFFGREREARDLLSLVIAERLVLFYAQSGAGKTSLINTCLIPGLEENDRVVLPVGRVSGGLPAGVEAADNIFVFSLMLLLDQGGTAPAELAQLHLSSFLRNLVSADGQTYRYEPLADEAASQPDSGDAPVCVLIIDQFEEILTAHPGRWQDRAAFFRQLNQAMQDDPKLSVILALREDYVAALDPYAPLMAERMRARFYMERMGRKAALAAVSKPAAAQGRPFAPGAAELLVDNLSLIRTSRSKEAKPGEHIEPVQLQVVCCQLWEKTAQAEEITAEQVKGAGDIDHALADFYELALADALRTVKVSELELRRWFDHQLITPAGTRGTVFQGEEATAGMDNRVVRLLEDRFLLRAESRSGAAWYELVHDRFVRPIQQANRAWLDRQGPLLRDAQAWLDSGKVDRSLLYTGEKLAKTLAEIGDKAELEPVVAEFLAGCKGRQAYLDEKAAANRRVRTWFKVAVAVAVVAVLASLWAGWASYRAKEAEQTALDSQKKTEETLTQLQRTEKLNMGMALNARAKAEIAEGKGSRLYAHLYSLHALDKLAQHKDTDAYLEAMLRAQATPVPLPAFRGYHDQSDGIMNGIAFSPDGRLVASASKKTIGIWDAQTGSRLDVWNFGASNVSFSPDGRLFASGLDGKTIGIWDVKNNNRLPSLKEWDSISSITLSPDGHLLASARYKTISIRDVQTGNRVADLAGQHYVTSLSFSPDNKTVAFGSNEESISIWDMKQKSQPPYPLDVYTGGVNSVSFSPDGQIVAAASLETIDLWDMKEKNMQTKKPLKTLKGDTGCRMLSVSFSPNGQTIASVSRDKSIGIWDVQTGQRLRMLDGHAGSVRSVAFSPDGQTIVSSGSAVELWEAAEARVRLLKGHAGRVRGLSFSPDGQTILSASKDKTIGVWDAATGKRLQKRQMESCAGGVNIVSFSPDSRMFAAALKDKTVGIWDVITGQRIKNLPRRQSITDSIAFSLDGSILAYHSWEKTIDIWNVHTSQSLQSLSDAGETGTISLSPDGHSLALSSQKRDPQKNITFKDITFFNVSSGNLLQRLPEGDGNSIVFSPDGQTFAAGLLDNSIGIYAVSSKKRLNTLKGHAASVTHLFYSPNSRLLASRSMDGSIGLWDMKSGKRLRTLKRGNLSGSESIIAFSPDSRSLAFTTDDNSIGLWDLEDNPNEFSGIALDANGEYKIDLNTLPYKLEGLELKPIEQKSSPDQPARWSKYHPFHWLPQAEAGDSNAMLQIGIIYDRNNDLARALQWYGKAIKAGSKQAEEQQSRLLHWLEDKDNWQTVPIPFRDAFCKAKAEFALPEKAAAQCK